MELDNNSYSVKIKCNIDCDELENYVKQIADSHLSQLFKKLIQDSDGHCRILVKTLIPSRLNCRNCPVGSKCNPWKKPYEGERRFHVSIPKLCGHVCRNQRNAGRKMRFYIKEINPPTLNTLSQELVYRTTLNVKCCGWNCISKNIQVPVRLCWKYSTLVDHAISAMFQNMTSTCDAIDLMQDLRQIEIPPIPERISRLAPFYFKVNTISEWKKIILLGGKAVWPTVTSGDTHNHPRSHKE